MEDLARGVIDYMTNKPPSVYNEMRRQGWIHASKMHMNQGVLPDIDISEFEKQETKQCDVTTLEVEK